MSKPRGRDSQARPTFRRSVPGWIVTIDQTIALIENVDYQTFGRAQLEAALQIHATAANRLLREMKASKEIGNRYAVPKEQLLAFLRAKQCDPYYTAPAELQEQRRARIESLRPHRGGHAKVALTAPNREQIERMTCTSLPTGVYLSQHTVWMTVDGWNDLLAKVGALICAIDNDRETVERLITGSPERAEQVKNQHNHQDRPQSDPTAQPAAKAVTAPSKDEEEYENQQNQPHRDYLVDPIRTSNSDSAQQNKPAEIKVAW